MCYFSKDEALNVLSGEGSYWAVNWKMVQYFNGFDEAIMLAYLCSMQKQFGNENGIFYRTIPSAKRDTTLDCRRQRKAINNLVELGLIETSNFGMPQKRHFRVRADRVAEFLESLRYREQISTD